jgi:hypothetical protein
VTNIEVVAADAPRPRRVVTLAAAFGLLVAVLFGTTALFGASPAYASTTPAAPSATGHANNTATRHAAASHTLLPDRDVLVGALAGVAMLGTAGAVLWYTARSRYLYY